MFQPRSRILLASLLALGLPGTALARKPVDVMRDAADQPFEVAPERLMAAAQKHIETLETVPSAVQLLNRYEWHIQDDGRRATVMHQLIYVHDSSGAEYMSELYTQWSPWIADQPTLRARVIAPDGAERWLKEDELVVGAPPQGIGDIYTTDKSIEGPLPGVAPGVLIEQMIETHPTHPLSTAASTFGVAHYRKRPILLERLVVETPSQRPLASTLYSEVPAPTREQTETGERLVWEAVEVTPFEVPPVPIIDFNWPVSHFSTGGSWTDVARSYHERVVGKQDLSGAEALVEPIAAATGRRDQITAALSAVRANIRYTGLEFGESAVVPYAPAEALARGYGDCKDQATLLVVLLEAVGISARLALVSASNVDQVQPAHPGLEPFDHVIVYLPDDDIWIDPTFPPAALGELPSVLQGNHALIVDPQTEGLTQIPTTSAEDNTFRETRRLQYRYGTPMVFSETVAATGSPAHNSSMLYADLPTDGSETALHAYTTDTYGTSDIEVQLQLTSASQPRFELELSGHAYTVLWDQDIPVTPIFDVVFSLLPEMASVPPKDSIRATGDVEIDPHIAEMRFVVDVPPGYEPSAQLAPVTVELGDAQLQWVPTWTADQHQLETMLRFHTGDGRFTPDELDTLRRWATEGVPEIQPVTLTDPGRHHVETRQSIQAMKHYQSVLDSDDAAARAWAHGLRARVLLNLGLYEAALASAERGVALLPDNAYTQYELGYVLLHDSLAQAYGSSMDHARAVAIQRTILALGGTADDPLTTIAGILDNDKDRLERRRSPEAVAEAIEALVDRDGPANLPEGTLWSLVWVGKAERVVELTAERHDAESAIPRLAAITLSQGIQPMLQDARQRAGTSEQEAERLALVYRVLLELRAYAALDALLEARPELSPDPAQTTVLRQMLRETERTEDVLDLATHPEHTLFQHSMDCILDEGSATWTGVVSAYNGKPSPMWTNFCIGMRSKLGDPGSGLGVALDQITHRTTYEVEKTTPNSARVTWTFPGQTPTVGYTTFRDGQWYLASIDGSAFDIGAEAFIQLKKGRAEDAEQWMTWLEAQKGPSSGTFGELGTQLTEAGVSDKARNLLLAASAAGGEAGTVAAWKRHGPRAAELAPDAVGPLFRRMLWILLERHQNASLVELAQSPWGAPLLDESAAAMVESVVDRVADPEERLAMLPPASERTPLDWRRAARLHNRLHDHVAAREALEAIQSDEPSPNSRAWEMVMAGGPMDEAAALMSDHLANTGQPELQHLHTLATALAESDQPDAAAYTIRRGLELEEARSADELPDYWWHVYGRMAESLGLTDVARAYYEKVGDEEEYRDTRYLVNRRLEQLP